MFQDIASGATEPEILATKPDILKKVISTITEPWFAESASQKLSILDAKVHVRFWGNRVFPSP